MAAARGLVESAPPSNCAWLVAATRQGLALASAMFTTPLLGPHSQSLVLVPVLVPGWWLVCLVLRRRSRLSPVQH